MDNYNYITTTEAATLSGMTRQAITSRIKRGLYPSAEKRGRDWFLNLEEVEELMRNPPRVGRKHKSQ